MDLNNINTQNSKAAIKGIIYSGALKALLEPELIGMNYVDMITDFTDGDTYQEIEMGSANYHEYEEGTPVKYDSIDFGVRTFTINHYATSGHIVTAKFYQDSHLANQIQAAIPSKEARALAAKIEKEIFELHKVIHTPGEANAIETMSHRFIAGHAVDESEKDFGTITPYDMAYAITALNKANYFGNTVAIVPLYQALAMSQSKALSQSIKYQPQWGSLVNNGALTGMHYTFTLAGVDIYASNFTDVVASETLNTAGGESKTATKAGVALVFSNTAGMRPFRMAWRQMPSFTGWFDNDLQVEKYLTICRYGLGAGEKGNLISILCKTDGDTRVA
jgi:hypothetical protein